MAKNGRRPGFKMSEEHREKLSQSNILTYLVKFVEGERKMSAAQAATGVALLKKWIPDLSTVEMSGPEGGPIEQTVEFIIVDTDKSSEDIPPATSGEGTV